MSKVIITCVITVDGLIEAPAPAPDGWLIMEGDQEPLQFELLQNSAGTLLGRKNYEGFAAVWPSMAGDGRWADLLNPMRKWVASTTLTGPLEWNSTLIKGNVVDEVQRLKSELDGDLITSGAGAFARFLVESGLVDEVWFWVHPTIQGPETGRSMTAPNRHGAAWLAQLRLRGDFVALPPGEQHVVPTETRDEGVPA